MSLFGEIQLGQSRAVSDDEDDEYSQIKEDENLKRKVYWLSEQSEKAKVDELIVADGYLSCVFLHTYLLNHLMPADLKLLGLTGTLSEYKIHQVNHEHNASKQHENSFAKLRTNFVYLLENFNGKSYLICQLYHQLKSTEIYDWINQLWDRVEFGKSTIFSGLNKVSYYGTNEEKFPFVKFISSEKMLRKDDSSCAPLEEPNFVGSLPAGVIHFCISKSLPFLAFVCYTATLGIDLHSIKQIYNATRDKYTHNRIFIENELSKKTLTNIERMETSTNNLYM